MVDSPKSDHPPHQALAKHNPHELTTRGDRPGLELRAAQLQIREGGPGDLAWIDQMQKVHAGHLGFLWAKALEKRIDEKTVRIAVDSHGTQFAYIMWGEGYNGRDDVTICYQLAVAPAHYRRLIGASLVAAWIESLPYGFRLAGCWCAQDLPANNFWEACGFQAMAWRTGSRIKQRPHIWWCRHVRIDDHFPMWMPAKTQGGAIGEERLIIPIMPDQRWDDPVTTFMPEAPGDEVTAAGLPKVSAEDIARLKRLTGSEAATPQIGYVGGKAADEMPRPVVTRQGIKFIGGASAPPPGGRKKKVKVKRKYDPELKRKVRDLRDRYLDALNSGQISLPSNEKWNVGRIIDPSRLLEGITTNRGQGLLPAASEVASLTQHPSEIEASTGDSSAQKP